MKNYKTKLQDLHKDPEFMAFIEEAMKIEGKIKKVLYVLKATKCDEYDNVQRRFPYYITDRDLAELTDTSVGSVDGAKKKLGIRGNSEKEKVNSSRAEHIGEGDESVYLYYFPTYKQYAELRGLDHYRCNIGRTDGNVEDRIVAHGDQLPEKPTLSLVMLTNDCETLETEIRNELKRRGQHLDPNSGADVVGVEWFSTNPAEVKDIFDSLKLSEEERNTEYMRYQEAKKFLADSASCSKEELEKMSREQLQEYAEKSIRNSKIVKEYESNN